MLEKGNIFNTESISVIVRQSWPKQLLLQHYILNADRSACADRSVSACTDQSVSISVITVM